MSIIVISSLVAKMAKNPPAIQETQFDPWLSKILWRRQWQPILVFLPGEFHGQRSLGGLQSMGSQSQTQLSDIHFLHFHKNEHLYPLWKFSYSLKGGPMKSIYKLQVKKPHIVIFQYLKEFAFLNFQTCVSFFFKWITFDWRIITLQYCDGFCHT